MKYVILTFDDGLLDYFENARPEMRKFGFNGVIGVISGSVDGTRKKDSQFSFMNIDEIKKCVNEGDEISLHSDLHVYEEDSIDFGRCYKKVSSWFGDNKYGVIMPYNINPDKKLISYFEEMKIPYIAGSENKETKISFFNKLLYKITKINKYKLAASNKFNILKINNRLSTIQFINRIEIKRKYSADDYYYVINQIKNNSCVVLMFHSILNNRDDECPYPNGSWTKSEFNKLLTLLSSNKSIRVITIANWIKMNQAAKNKHNKIN